MKNKGDHWVFYICRKYHCTWFSTTKYLYNFRHIRKAIQECYICTFRGQCASILEIYRERKRIATYRTIGHFRIYNCLLIWYGCKAFLGPFGTPEYCKLYGRKMTRIFSWTNMVLVRNNKNAGIYMQNNLKIMNDESQRVPKRPQECILRLNEHLLQTFNH